MAKSKREQEVLDYVADQHKEESKYARTNYEGALCRGTEYKVRHGEYHPSDPRHPSRQD